MDNSVQREGTHEQQCTEGGYSWTTVYRGRVLMNNSVQREGLMNNSVQREGTHEQQCTEGGYS